MIDRHGAIVLTNAKVHTCVFDHREDALPAGAGFRVGTLNTRHERVRLGAMTCSLREFPEGARVLVLPGFDASGAYVRRQLWSFLRGHATANNAGCRFGQIEVLPAVE